MSHFAQVVDGIVTQVIVAEQDVIDSGIFGSGWVQTSFNTRANQHPDGAPLRKNFAGVGFTYDEVRDAFVSPKPFDSWVLDDETCTWNPPIPRPAGGLYSWDEGGLSWVPVQIGDAL